MRVTPIEGSPELLERFFACEAELYAHDPIWARLPRRDLRPLLAPDAPFVRRGGRQRSFLALEGDVARGRVTAIVGPRLLTDDGRPQGLVGLWECADDPAAARALLDAAFEWLRAQGAVQAVGPLDFSTWYRYRFVSEGREKGPFLLDLHHHAWYPDQFRAAGFAPAREYATLVAPHTPVKLLARAHERCVAAGVRFEPLEAAGAAERLPLLFDLSRRIFAGKTAYSEIDPAEFQALYAGSDALLVPGLSWLARDGSGQAVGFLFAYPDLLEPLRKGDPAAKVETTVLKTIAADPDAAPGLGWALCHLHVEAARALGFTRGLYALMEKFEELGRFMGHKGRMLEGETGGVWKRYTLYQRAL